jgi:hypothetical protein
VRIGLYALIYIPAQAMPIDKVIDGAKGYIGIIANPGGGYEDIYEQQQ